MTTNSVRLLENSAETLGMRLQATATGLQNGDPHAFAALATLGMTTVAGGALGELSEITSVTTALPEVTPAINMASDLGVDLESVSGSGIGSVADATNSVAADAGAAADWAKPSGWRLPATNGQWSGIPGNSNWTSFNDNVNAVTGDQPIPFRNGYPDFSQWSQGTFTFDNLTGTNADFGLVYDAVAQEYGLANRTAGQNLLRDLGLTPHHVEDGLTIELVPTDLHGNVPHIGGASNLRNGN